ncbi:MAG: tetratricopeptide repeat protein [Paracoccaceae bacterium]
MDLSGLLNFGDLAGTKARLEQALADATGPDAVILQSQLARCAGLVRDFAVARKILGAIDTTATSPLAQAYVQLEWGRTYCSATHDSSQLTDADRSTAQTAFRAAADLAREAGRDDLAIDAIHMLAFTETDPAAQLAHTRAALALAEGSTQKAAQNWRASLHNNLGCALHDMQDDDQALAHFQQALALRQQNGTPGPIRIARWMVAWTLRHLGRTDEAMALQLALERECEAAGAPDPFVFQEIAELYALAGDSDQASAYRSKAKPQA